MPELPEVQTVVTTLRPLIVGRVIAGVNLLRTDIVRPGGVDLPSRLLGRRIRAVDRRGKRILITLDDRGRFYVHLGMTGQLTVESPEAAVRPHTHLVLEFGESACLRFRDPRRFGGVFWIGADSDAATGLGPEPLDLKPSDLATRLAKTRRAVKNALLDQRVVAGLGNIYVDEALFEARVHPLALACELTPEEVRRLNSAIKKVLRRAIRHRGSTLRDYMDAEGAAGEAQKLHRVYGSEGKPCRSCGSPVQRIVLGGRSTHFCPSCQMRARVRRAKRRLSGRAPGP